MSYDLMVFDPETAPKEKDAFLAWYENSMDEAEGGTYSDPATTSLPLQAWYQEMKGNWPPMDGPDAGSFDVGERTTGYTFGQHMIYCDFRWSVAPDAHKAVVTLAAKHGVGFFDVSGPDALIILPNPS